MKCVPYASAVENLMFGMVCTHPYISQVVSLLSIFMENPRKEHWEAIKWVLRYLKGTVGTWLCFGGDSCQLNSFVDFDHAGGLDRWRSTIDYVFKIHGILVSRRSMLQATMTLSTIEVD